MTENEKLRALLAEARAWMGECDCRTKLISPADNAFLESIDAALAEPHWSSQVLNAALEHEAKQIRKSHSGFLTQLQRERDEARAEVERLRKERDAACMAAGEYSQDEVNEMTTDMIALRKAAERAAYQRGAEAMREKAANAIPGHYSGDIIRALPLPEDKP